VDAVEWDDDEAPPEADRPAVAENGRPRNMDLMTLAALAAWTDTALGKIGKDSLAPLLEISEMSGRLSKTNTEIILTLARLLGDSASGERITAKQLVMLLAHLDALSEGGGSSDMKLLSMMIDGDAEGLQLTRP
jgi:hypothetical protein